MGALAYMQGFPLAWGFLAVVLVAAGTSTLLNQARGFLVAYSPQNKVYISDCYAFYGVNPDQKQGYCIALTITNSSDVPMEYKAVRKSARFGDRAITVHSAKATDGDVIEPHRDRRHVLGAVVSPPMEETVIEGEVDFEFIYGRPGKLNYTTRRRYALLCQLDEQGAVTKSSFHPQPIT